MKALKNHRRRAQYENIIDNCKVSLVILTISLTFIYVLFVFFSEVELDKPFSELSEIHYR